MTTKPTARQTAATLQRLADSPLVPTDTAAACRAAAAVLAELGALVGAGEYPQDSAALVCGVLERAGLDSPSIDAHKARALALAYGYTLAYGGNPAGYYFHKTGFVPESPTTHSGIVEAWQAVAPA